MNSGSYKTALWLSYFTIVYNLIEGIASIGFGYVDETLSLFGFGIDSFIEMISGFGILQMVIRIRRNPGSGISRFEISALRITGYGFYLLAFGLAAGVVLNIVQKHVPESTTLGAVIATLSIIVMFWLYRAKKKVAKSLNSEPLLSDANCTLVCIYMSVVLLLSSLVYEFTGFAYADAIGAAGLIYFSIKEGNEALEKARKKNHSCSCCKD